MRLLTCIAFLLSFQFISAQDFPLGYIKQFNATITKAKVASDFSTSSTTQTKITNAQLHVDAVDDTVHSNFPEGVLLVDKLIWGDFMAKLSLMTKSTGDDSLDGLYFLTGVRDSSNYYFIQLNSYGANFYKMYKGEVSLIDSDSSFVLPEMTWLNLQVTRDILKRTIQIESAKKSIEFYDPNLIMGYMGFGISNAIFSLRKLTVWAPTVIEKPCTLFLPPVEKTAAEKLPE